MTNSVQAQNVRPDAVWAVGRMVTAGGVELWPSRCSERSAAAADAKYLLQALGVTAGDAVVITSLMAEGVQFVPIEDAVEALRAVVMPADGTERDASRVASFLRRFELRAVVGLGVETVRGLREQGAVESLARVPLVLARSETHDELQAVGVEAYACDPVGPTLAIECPARAGAHLLGGWLPVVDDGTIVLSSPDRGAIRTTLGGAVTAERCSCGLAAPRVVR